MHRWLKSCAVASLAIGLVAGVIPTPADPGEHASCGTLFGGGFTSALFACEQTRGVFRAIVLLAPVMAAVLLIGLRARGKIGRWFVFGTVATGAVLVGWLSVAVLFGDLTQRWIALLPAALSAVGVIGALAAFNQARLVEVPSRG